MGGVSGNTDRFVLVDCETFGLDPQTDWILELGFLIVDQDLNLIDRWDTPIWTDGLYDNRLELLQQQAHAGGTGSKIVLDMHVRSGLFDIAQAQGMGMVDAQVEARDFLASHGVNDGDPMCGSSVQFDRDMLREQLPNVFNKFSYRNIDTSTIKELCRRVNPRVYSLLDETTHPQKLHRVVPDLDDTLGELKFYLDNFVFVG
jgi:oligoribonuclease